MTFQFFKYIILSSVGIIYGISGESVQASRPYPPTTLMDLENLGKDPRLSDVISFSHSLGPHSTVFCSAVKVEIDNLPGSAFLTAGHCLPKRSLHEDEKAMVINYNGVEIPVTYFGVHPLYLEADTSTIPVSSNDIALLYSEQPTGGKGYKLFQGNPKGLVGQELIQVGYGYYYKKESNPHRRAFYTQITDFSEGVLVADDEVSRAKGYKPKAFVTNGDSGGGLLWFNPSTGDLELVGMASATSGQLPEKEAASRQSEYNISSFWASLPITFQQLAQKIWREMNSEVQKDTGIRLPVAAMAEAINVSFNFSNEPTMVAQDESHFLWPLMTSPALGLRENGKEIDLQTAAGNMASVKRYELSSHFLKEPTLLADALKNFHEVLFSGGLSLWAGFVKGSYFAEIFKYTPRFEEIIWSYLGKHEEVRKDVLLAAFKSNNAHPFNLQDVRTSMNTHRPEVKKWLHAHLRYLFLQQVASIPLATVSSTHPNFVVFMTQAPEVWQGMNEADKREAQRRLSLIGYGHLASSF